jgi:hypothetical protein
MEMWSVDNYREMIGKEPDDLSALAQKIAHLRTNG